MSKIYIYLHREDLVEILKFLDAFKSDKVEVISDNSSGIGSIITAKINEVVINNTPVNVERIISDEKDW